MNSRELQPIIVVLLIIMRILIVLAITACILLIVFLSVRYALPFLIACVLAFLINPIVIFIEKKIGLPRGAASFVVLFSFFSLSIGILLFTAIALIKGVSSYSRSIPSEIQVLLGDLQTFFFSHLVPSWEQAMHIFSGMPDSQQKAIQLNIESIAGTLVDMINDLATQLLTNLTQFVTTIPDTLISAAFIFLAAFFLSKDSEQIKSRFLTFSTRSVVGKTMNSVFIQLKKTCFGFVRAQFILIMMTMGLVYIGLLVMKVPHPFTIALITGIVDLIPYLGTGAIFIPWIIYQFFMHHYFLTISLSSLYIATIIQRQLMEPKIMSSNIGLDPFASLVSIYFGFRWLGIAGLVIGPITLVIIKTLYTAGTWHIIWFYILGKKT
ncbi:sporulation integral membrane protein YtvI [Sporolactobacillus kofuensis]|uniref:Sporulation integral membrane protein YtvI n=1 Tax=Sporolactobacillus kofuensis TaxID=269672 RepID=A0ABW1WAY6_9BACL|nr:sporulation integral membrane protein YtvI [Sporolactobacillus kofuensis]MCO7175945.1 sporulation integral membrane protein YtvI [Sporolactobacillus kofuensis]